MSGGNIPVAEEQYADVDQTAFAQLIETAVMVSALDKMSDKRHEEFDWILKAGEDIARGGNGNVSRSRHSVAG